MNTQAHSPLTTFFPASLLPPIRLSLQDALTSATETKALLVGPGEIERVTELFIRHFPGRRAIVVGDTVTLPLAAQEIHETLAAVGLTVAAPFVFNATDLYAEFSYVETLESALRQHDGIPVAVGSGTINDLVKLAAHRVGRAYLCVATAASMDGYTAFGASITYRGAKQTFNCPAPRAVIADLELIRTAPHEMTASGYADLQAKITAGADWLVADALNVERIDPRSWSIVQGGLRDALADPAGARRGSLPSIGALTEGLMLGGFAMQWSKSSRPASGAEHQFSHLWDMEHHTHHGQAPSHGFKVGLATLAISSLYEELFKLPLESLDVEACCARWPSWTDTEADIRQRFAGTDFIETAVDETAAKFPTVPQLRAQLELLREVWPQTREMLRAQLLPTGELRRRLQIVGAPTTPGEIGLTRERLRATFQRAYFIRRRFTVLDLAVRTGTLETCLAALFGSTGPWGQTTATP